MYHLVKFGSQFLKKFDQITKRGKMVKIRILIEERQSLNFWPRKWSIGLRYDLKSPISPCWPNDMVQNIASPLDWHMNFLVNWSKVNCILKNQTLTFWSNLSTEDHNSSKHVKIWNLFIKKSRNKEIKKSKIQDFIFKSQIF